MPRKAIARVSGDPVIILPLVASPPARLTDRSANRSTSIISRVSCLTDIAVAASQCQGGIADGLEQLVELGSGFRRLGMARMEIQLQNVPSCSDRQRDL